MNWCSMAHAEYEALARRVETEDRSLLLLDAIARVVGWKYCFPQGFQALDKTWHSNLPNWLLSIDAAASLVPNHMRWAVGPDLTKQHVVRATVWVDGHARGRVVDGIRNDGLSAAALTAAALRAIATEQDDD